MIFLHLMTVNEESAMSESVSEFDLVLSKLNRLRCESRAPVVVSDFFFQIQRSVALLSN